MTHTYFNRHQNMTSEVRAQVRHFIEVSDEHGKFLGEVTNFLYGLYDGFLYEDLLPEAKKFFPTNEYEALEKMVKVIKAYPKTETDTTEH